MDYLADLEADFLAIYHIDLADESLTGPRMFSLARRVFAYPGVMAARWEQLQQQEPATRSPVRQEPHGAQVVELAAFRANFPGLVSHTQVDGGR